MMISGSAMDVLWIFITFYIAYVVVFQLKTMRNPWKTRCVGTHLECSAEFWCLCLRWVRCFHFLGSDSSSPKHKNLDWEIHKTEDRSETNVSKKYDVVSVDFILAVAWTLFSVLQAGRDESDTVDEAQAVVDAKARVFILLPMSRIGPPS